MNVTLNTNRFNTPYGYQTKKTPNNNNYYNRTNYKNNNNVAFTGNKLSSIFEAIPIKSKFLDPMKRGFDKLTTGIAEHYTVKLYTSKPAQWLAKSAEKLDSVVDHMQVMGSVIISGMYMIQTLRQKNMDEDRKKTLAINQGLTFGVSTLGSYLIDSSLDEIWEGLTQKYAAKQIGDKKLPEKIAKLNDAIIKEAEAKTGLEWKKIGKKQRPKLVTALKYIEDNVPNTGVESKIRGMGVCKKLFVFGTVYRFIAPVAVTPIASWLGEKLMAKKKGTDKAQNDTPAKQEQKPEENKKVA